ncbi:MAG: nucleotidyltransferase family protein [Candidatus Eisenbacteria bacterium]|nr:nucleotidyltransferase family protein [Candidatus Eisenbacteria bacterium]
MVSTVVLAAGESKRMGRKKEALPIAGEPMVSVVVRKLLGARGVDEVVVVLGHGAEEVGAALSGIADERIELVGNRRYAEGMGASLALGASACSWGADAILVALADAPFFRTQDVEALLAAHGRGAKIAVPAFGGRRGHPVLFDGSYRERLEALAGDAGARGILESDAASVVEVELDDDGFLLDIDEDDDYEAVRGGVTTT